ncbi:hypothetical protein ILYODFUR_024174 [Ilyodon furcidens]|uniref:Uncharacterized protein n=1 Tax=Ilyodon furcidens TaxID=33524 RepID=A0ABV0V7V5_9TELE
MQIHAYTHTYSFSEIPLAGRACCLSIGGPHHALQRLYIEVIIFGFQAPSYIFPSPLLFCINRTSSFRFLKCFPAGQPILTVVLGKVTHVSFFSILSVSSQGMKEERKQK